MITKSVPVTGETGATVEGTVRISGARNVILKGLNVVGGVEIRDCTSFTLDGVTVGASPADGIVVEGSTGTISGCTVEDAKGSGIVLSFTSRVTVRGTTVRRSGKSGVVLLLGAQTRITDSIVADNRGDGISVAGSVADIGDTAMGDAFNEGDSDERPVHTVPVSAFYMDRYEVTKALWDEVASWAQAHGYDIRPSDGSGKAPNHPVHRVSWYEAVKWCNARSEKEGRIPASYTSGAKTTVYCTGRVDVQNDWVRWDTGYRLPTEAEWEKAARGGCAGHRFPWCDTDTIGHSRANYWSSSSYRYDTSPTRGYHPAYKTGSAPYTSPVGSFAPNGYGLYDMAGTVWEWCWDWRSRDYYASSPGTDPRGPASGTGRAIRGGSWGADAFSGRVAFRHYYGPSLEYDYLGFRAVLPVGP